MQRLQSYRYGKFIPEYIIFGIYRTFEFIMAFLGPRRLDKSPHRQIFLLLPQHTVEEQPCVMCALL
jgi:hypothetical protein